MSGSLGIGMLDTHAVQLEQGAFWMSVLGESYGKAERKDQ